MSFVMLLVIVLMVGKDTFQLGDPYYMRGAAQVLALLVAVVVLFSKPPGHAFRRYWPVMGYVLCLLLTSTQSSSPSFVLLQIGSLCSMLLLAVAYFGHGEIDSRYRIFIWSVIGIYFCVSLASLIVAKIIPGIAYESLYAGDAYGDEIRFRGLFSKSAMMSAAAGLLIGVAWFNVKSVVGRVVLILPGLICIALTLSRTFWIATVAAGVLTSWYYYPFRRKLVIQWICVAVLVTIAAFALNLTVTKKSVSDALRLNSITTLSGRTDLWQRGLRALEYRPLLGYGLTLGSEGLQQKKNGIDTPDINDARKVARASLHNGYMQSVLDSGVIGTLFYLLVITIAFFRFLHRDVARRYGAAFYSFLFLALANLGESIIYSASVFHSVFFWFLAIFALSLESSPKRMAPKFGNILRDTALPSRIA